MHKILLFLRCQIIMDICFGIYLCFYHSLSFSGTLCKSIGVTIKFVCTFFLVFLVIMITEKVCELFIQWDTLSVRGTVPFPRYLYKFQKYVNWRMNKMNKVRKQKTKWKKTELLKCIQLRIQLRHILIILYIYRTYIVVIYDKIHLFQHSYKSNAAP